MPIYEFACGSCGEEFEKRVKFNDADDAVNCPECGSNGVNRKLSLFSMGGSSRKTSGSVASGANCAPTGF